MLKRVRTRVIQKEEAGEPLTPITDEIIQQSRELSTVDREATTDEVAFPLNCAEGNFERSSICPRHCHLGCVSKVSSRPFENLPGMLTEACNLQNQMHSLMWNLYRKTL
ncbi:hypothetical protein TNCV_3092461 [Trichonephila clavipes]|uniref:Uncharacterized protein n=1 Tax=Trichonephila clavipes TaxID=2585209 RepID=A0A8X6VEZ7_TRICX|nr:hypothetical protein TNCV_3092461 [Trichonephila clavipes]